MIIGVKMNTVKHYQSQYVLKIMHYEKLTRTHESAENADMFITTAPLCIVYCGEVNRYTSSIQELENQGIATIQVSCKHN